MSRMVFRVRPAALASQALFLRKAYNISHHPLVVWPAYHLVRLQCSCAGGSVVSTVSAVCSLSLTPLLVVQPCRPEPISGPPRGKRTCSVPDGCLCRIKQPPRLLPLHRCEDNWDLKRNRTYGVNMPFVGFGRRKLRAWTCSSLHVLYLECVQPQSSSLHICSLI